MEMYQIKYEFSNTIEMNNTSEINNTIEAENGVGFLEIIETKNKVKFLWILPDIPGKEI